MKNHLWERTSTSIAFIDTKVSLEKQEILDIGGIKENGNTFHSNSTSEFICFIDGTRFICGHNILNHDLKYLQKTLAGKCKRRKF
jgi:ATP-dependent DNA helicase RecQ